MQACPMGAHLHLAVVQVVAHVVSIHRADADVADSRHHPFNRHRGNSRVGRGPAEIAAPTRSLERM